tara:strand:- start:20347 stop:21267 length:921 start_codon:yes stop_codon:yes gene_type:complete
MKYYLFLLLFITTNTCLLSKNINKNSPIQEKNNLNTEFPILNLKEKYSLFDENEYFIITKNTKKLESIILDSIFKNNVSLNTVFSIGPSSNKNASFGVKVISDIDTNKFISIQINKNGEYNISSKINKNVWKKNRVINLSDEDNSIKIKSKKGKYEIYINNMFIQLVDKIESENINVGICISSQSKARLSFISILENKDSKNKISTNKLTNTKENNRSNEKYIDFFITNTFKKQTYSVQIGAYLAEKEFLVDSNNIWFEKNKQNIFIYYSGNFLTDIEATIHKNNLEKKGYKNIFVTKIEKQPNDE